MIEGNTNLCCKILRERAIAALEETLAIEVATIYFQIIWLKNA